MRHKFITYSFLIAYTSFALSNAYAMETEEHVPPSSLKLKLSKEYNLTADHDSICMQSTDKGIKITIDKRNNHEFELRLDCQNLESTSVMCGTDRLCELLHTFGNNKVLSKFDIDFLIAELDIQKEYFTPLRKWEEMFKLQKQAHKIASEISAPTLKEGLRDQCVKVARQLDDAFLSAFQSLTLSPNGESGVRKQ